MDRLEAELFSLKMESHGKQIESYLDKQEPKVEISTTTISEKILEKNSVFLDAYDQAKRLLEKGSSLTEVAHQTGLSVSELRLLEKFNQKEF
jgi:hypothetical protein